LVSVLSPKIGWRKGCFLFKNTREIGRILSKLVEEKIIEREGSRKVIISFPKMS
jgi:hypothetical protein